MPSATSAPLAVQEFDSPVASGFRATVVALIERRRQQPMGNIWRADLRDAAAEVLRAELNRED